MSNPQKYTVGWICAIPTEYTAAQAFLDEEHEPPAAVAQHDDNHYTLGTIGRHNVVIAVLPSGEYGLTSAATVARDMLHSFPNVRIGLLVGIGGGAPSPKHDIRLGDIVVGDRNGTSSGVFQYDFGKSVQNQQVRFQDTSFLNQAPKVLRGNINGLKSMYERKGHQLLASVDKAIERYKRMEKGFSRPPAESDRLYTSTTIHPDDEGGCEALCGTDPAKLVTRKERGEHEDDPIIHYGLIASGNQLMKNAVIRDKLAAERDVLCFEMEAAGLMNHFPCLVIRGICDYSDSHKNKDWQGFAAMMAGAYASDLLRQIPPNKVEAEGRIGVVLGLIHENVECLRQDMGQLMLKTTVLEAGQHEGQIHRWLSPPDPSSNAALARSLRHEGTGTWLFEHHSFLDWKVGNRLHIWLYGGAGAGKTVLSTAVLDHLADKYDCQCVSFFFDFNDSRKRSLDSLLRSLAYQLYRAGGDTAKKLDDLRGRNNSGNKEPQPDTKALSSTVGSMMETLSGLIIILDALDECTTRHDLLYWMECLVNNLKLTNVKLFVTGRPESDLSQRLPHLFGKENCMPLDKQAVDKDISSYVDARLRRDSRFTSKPLSRHQIDLIRSKVGNGADGMFRWATCQLDTLADCDSLGSLKSALNNLPPDLKQTYSRILHSLQPDVREKGIHLLKFLVHAEEPLTVEEANDVIATHTETDKHYFDIERRLFNDEGLLRYCPSLILITTASYWDWKNGTDAVRSQKEVHLAHFSVKEFLLFQTEYQIEHASIPLVKTCLAHLESEETTSKEIECLNRPLRERAARFVFEFARFAETCDHVFRGLIHIFRRKDAVGLFESYIYPRWLSSVPSWTIYIASEAKLPRVLSSLVEGADLSDLDDLCEGNEWALDAATANGYEDIVKILLENNACPEGSSQPCPLSVASRKGHKTIVKLLLDHGASLQVSDSLDFREDPLFSAVDEGHIEIAKLLLDYGANVLTSYNEHGDDALSRASWNGDQKMVELLLNRGAGKTSEGKDHLDALWFASNKGHENIVKILLEGCVEFFPENDLREHPLYAASYGGHAEIVRLLLDHSTKLHINDMLLQLASMKASGSRALDITRMLLKHGTDFCADSPESLSASLIDAVTENHFEMVDLLLSEGADPNTTEDQNGVTSYVLTSASYAGNEEIVQILLENGADANAVNGNGETALYKALLGEHLEIMKTLLRHGARIGVGINVIEYCIDHNLKVMQGCIVLMGILEASKRDDLAEVQLILKCATRTEEWWDHYDETFDSASTQRHSSVSQFLQEERFRHASVKDDQNLVEMLLVYKSGVNSEDNQHYRTVRVPAKNGQNIMSLLLSKGEAGCNLKLSVDDSLVDSRSTPNEGQSETTGNSFMFTQDEEMMDIS